MKKTSISTRRLVLTAMLAALTTVGSAIRITMPLSIAGTTSFHLGNVMCALSGLMLGPWLGALAAGLGSALYDMFNPLYISEAWITFLIKAVYGLAAGLVMLPGKEKSYGRTVVAAAAGAIGYGIVYLLKSYFYNGLLVKGLTSAAALLYVLEKIPATIFNGVIAVIFAPILYKAITKALAQNHITLE